MDVLAIGPYLVVKPRENEETVAASTVESGET
jgi:hypothetical protein